MRADFVNGLSEKLKVKRRDLLEKDVILHQLLSDLSKDGFFSKNFAFKGGTCLTKCYYGYKRFSEDIDFTWRNQQVYGGKSQNELRRYLSGIIDRTGEVFEGTAGKRGLRFRCAKSDRHFVELSGSNKICTFKMWYDSEILGRESFIKVQINFVEAMCFRTKSGRLKSLIERQDSELKALYPEYPEYARTIRFNVYDIREILSEKVRAILTRRGTKARDFVDVYLIWKSYGIEPKDVETCIARKIKLALRLYERFNAQFQEKARLLDAGRIFDWGTERDLLISEIDEREFYSFVTRFEGFLRETVKAVSSP